ncbi:MAG: mitochondrial fission ELM1 family protein [Gammaproteobacteria bacterium]|jgi:mitochondrial fission protein ELM1
MIISSSWVITDAKPGMENQCLGLAEALGLDIVRKHVYPRPPWKYLPPGLWWTPLRAYTPDSDPLVPPWPDVLIATGRATVAAAIAIRRASQGRTFTIQIQNPGVAFRHFDLIIPPRHDNCSGPNVFPTRGALHRVTAERLAAEAARFAPSLAHLPRPLVAVLIGGTNKIYRVTPEIIRGLADKLAAMSRATGAGLLVTLSRRSGAEAAAVLRDRLADIPTVIWEGDGDNPYFAYLGLADHIVVTADSVSMVSEACSTGKPVYVVELEGGSRKFQRFHQGLRADGVTRPFTGVLANWHYAPLNDTQLAAAEVRRRLAQR